MQKSPEFYKSSKKSFIRQVREFGPAYYDMPTILQNVAKLLRVLTLNIDTNYTKALPAYYYILTITTAATHMFVFTISAAWFIVHRCLVNGDVIRAIIVFSLCIATEIGNAKFICIYVYRDIVKKIVRLSLEFNATVVPGSRYSESVLETLRKAKMRAFVFWLIIMGNGVVYIAKPLLSPGRLFMDGLYTIYGLEPMEKSPNYELGYTLITSSVWFLCYVPASVTALLILIAGFIEANMLALAQELNHILPDATFHYNKGNFIHTNSSNTMKVKIKHQILNEFISAKLQEIIKKHTINLHLLQMLEEVFKVAIAFEFMLLAIGLIAELLGGLKNTYLEIPYALVQVSMDCWTGQRVIDAGEAFEKAVYGCKWEQFDLTNMKIVLLMLGSSQKTMKLSAGGVTTLSFACLMSVLKSIYSAYTTLQSTIK